MKKQLIKQTETEIEKICDKLNNIFVVENRSKSEKKLKIAKRQKEIYFKLLKQEEEYLKIFKNI